MLLDSEMRIKHILLEKEIAQIISYFPRLSCYSLCCQIIKKKRIYATKQYFCHKMEGEGVWVSKMCRPILLIFIFEVFVITSIDQQKTSILIQTPTNIRQSLGLINYTYAVHLWLTEFNGDNIKSEGAA